MKPTLIILIGPPCTGKSTWSKNYIATHDRTLRFNRDEIRLMLLNQPMLDSLGESVVTSMIDVGIDSALSIGRDCILDQTNCRISYINKFIRQFAAISNIRFKIFQEPLSTLWIRNEERSKETKMSPIPAYIIKNMYDNQTTMLQSDEFKKIIEEYGYLV